MKLNFTSQKKFNHYQKLLPIGFALYCIVGGAYANVPATNQPSRRETEITLEKIIAAQAPAKFEAKNEIQTQNREQQSDLSVSTQQLKNAIRAQNNSNNTDTSTEDTVQNSVRQAIANYPLTEKLLSKLETIHQEIITLPAPEIDSNDDIRGGIDVYQKAIESRPDIMSILGRNLFSARQYILSMQAISNAFAEAVGVGDDNMAAQKQQISAANLAFGKKYSDRIRKLLQQ